MPKLVSEWLADLDSHGIYNADKLMKDFREQTGEEPEAWPIYTPAETKTAIVERGLGGTLAAESTERLTYAWSLANVLSYKYANGFRATAFGRGFAFRQCLEAIQKGGN